MRNRQTLNMRLHIREMYVSNSANAIDTSDLRVCTKRSTALILVLL